MPVYLKIPSIPGEVKEENHKKWIEVDSVQMGVNRGISARTGQGGQREGSAPSMSDMTFTRDMDDISPLIFQEALIGKPQSMTLHMLKQGEKKLELYLEVELSNAMVSSYNTSSGGDRPMESFTINFDKVSFVAHRAATSDVGKNVLSTINAWDTQ